jgi:hypothetical protein
MDFRVKQVGAFGCEKQRNILLKSSEREKQTEKYKILGFKHYLEQYNVCETLVL